MRIFFFMLGSQIMKKNKVIVGRWYNINKKIKKKNRSEISQD